MAIVLALTRKVLPQSGKVFMETRRIKNWGMYWDALEDWMSGRQKGNFFKPLGGGYSEGSRPYRDKENSYGCGYGRDSGERQGSERVNSYVISFNCGEKGQVVKKGVVVGRVWVDTVLGQSHASTVGRLGTVK